MNTHWNTGDHDNVCSQNETLEKAAQEMSVVCATIKYITASPLFILQVAHQLFFVQHCPDNFCWYCSVCYVKLSICKLSKNRPKYVHKGCRER